MEMKDVARSGRVSADAPWECSALQRSAVQKVPPRLDPRAPIGIDRVSVSQNSRPMSSPLSIDPALFDPATIPAETRAVNEEIVRRLNAEPPGLTIQEVRARRIAGIGAFPAAMRRARTSWIV